MTRHELGARASRFGGTSLFACAALLMAGAAAPASAQSTTEALLSTLGLVAPTPPEIEYRERAPLVVPRSTEILPPPRTEDDLANNPAWPKDYDEERRKQEAALQDPVSRSSKYVGIDPRPLSPSQVERGRRAGTNTGSGFDTRGDNKLSTREMDFKGWGSVFSSDGEKPLVFEGEPERKALVEPPPGYQTPAPNAVYGTVEKKDTGWKLPNWFDRTTPKD